MEIQLLKEQEIVPTKDVLQNTLGEIYSVLEELETRLTQDEFGLTFDWSIHNRPAREGRRAGILNCSCSKETAFR
jgi:hypothetical protein